MLFKIINNDKVKVLIEKGESENFSKIEKEISDGKIGDSVARLLVMIYENTGVNFLASKIIIESVRGIYNSYYVIVTRIIDSGLDIYDKACEDDEGNMYIFRLDGIEAFVDVLKILEKYHLKEKNKYKLYRYRKKEYVCLYLKNEMNKTVITDIETIATKCKWKLVNDSLLSEWGELICDEKVFLKSKQPSL